MRFLETGVERRVRARLIDITNVSERSARIQRRSPLASLICVSPWRRYSMSTYESTLQRHSRRYGDGALKEAESTDDPRDRRESIPCERASHHEKNEYANDAVKREE